MASGPCARCGRTQPPDELAVEQTSADPATEPLRLLRGTWTSIEGEDVCPDCQTPAELRTTGWRIVHSMEREIERRRREAIVPDDSGVEAALVSWVLALRAELEASSPAGEEARAAPGGSEADPQADTGRVGTRAPDRRSDAEDEPRAERAELDELQVAITGAFLTGHPLVIRIADHGALQSALAAALDRPGWQVGRFDAEDGTFESGGGFAEAMPLVLARREGHELVGQLRYRLENTDHARRAEIARDAAGYEVEPRRVRIDVYDLGMAVLTAWFDVSTPARAQPSDVARAVKRLVRLRPGPAGPAPIAQALQAIADETVEQYGRAAETAAPANLARTWLRHAPLSDSGRLLWLHPINVVEHPSPSAETTRQLAPIFNRVIEVDDGVFGAGIGWSAIVAAPGSDGAAAPVRLTELHWAYFALYMELDRGLLNVLNQARWTTSQSLKDLDREADEAFREYLRVMEARARLDSELSARGGDELAIWEAIAEVQRFDVIVEGVERKIEVLQRLTQRRADQAAADRSRRISDRLGWLAALTVLTVAIAVIGYFYGARPYVEGHDWVRVAAFVIAAAAAVALIWIAFPRRARRGAP